MHYALFLLIIIHWSIRRFSTAMKVHVINGRKDASTCCDKLPNSSFSTNCQTSYLWADVDEKYAYTPGFPNQFPIQKLCKWGIYARQGKRIRLEFRDFYLIGPGDDGMCYSQGVIIKSPLSNLEMGPHCGNAGLPTVVSAGNYLEVDLVSNIPMTSENYRGFKMAFVETVETPSPQLRPPNWGNDVALTADPLVIKRIFPSPTISSNGRRTGNSKTTSKPPRFKPGRKLGVLTTVRLPASERYRPPNISPPPSNVSNSLTLEEIVGIAVSAIVLLGIIILIVIRWKQTRKKKSKNNLDNMRNNQSSHPLPRPTDKNQPDVLQPDNALSPGYYVYYYHENEQKSKRNHRYTKENSSFPEKTRSKQRKTDSDTFKGMNVKDSEQCNHLQNLKSVSHIRSSRRTKMTKTAKNKNKGKKIEKQSEDKKDMRSDIGTSTRKNKQKSAGRNVESQQKIRRKLHPKNEESRKVASEEAEVFVIKKQRVKTKSNSSSHKKHLSHSATPRKHELSQNEVADNIHQENKRKRKHVRTKNDNLILTII